MTGKRHADLMRDIRGYISVLKMHATLHPSNFFVESTYLDAYNREKPCYLLTKKGCDLVANKMTGSKGILFTATYVTKFEDMEKQIKSNVPQISKEQELVLAIYNGGIDAVEATRQLKVSEAVKPLVEFAEQLSESNDCINVARDKI